MNASIPKREGQAINGTGVSVIAVVALILFLPLAQTSIVTVATAFGGEPEVEGYNDKGILSFPTGDTRLDNMAAFRWIDSGSAVTSACEPQWAATGTDPADYYSTSIYGTHTDANGHGPYTCDTSNFDQEVKGEFNGAYWVEHTGAVKEHAGTMEAGSSDFVFSIIDKSQDFSQKVPTLFAFEMWSSSVNLPSQYHNNTIGFDYEVSIEVWEYLEFVNGFPYQKYVLTEVKPAVWSGSHSYQNCGDILGFGCTKAWFELIHVLDGSDVNEWKDEITPLINEYSINPTMVGFRLHIDDMRDLTRGVRISSSPSPLPWETEAASAGPPSNPVYSTYWINTQSIESISQATKVTVGGLGVIFMLGAVASTPYWNPLMQTLNDRINRPQDGGRRYA